MVTDEKTAELVKYLEDQIVEYQTILMHLGRNEDLETYGFCRGAIQSMKYVRQVLKGDV